MYNNNIIIIISYCFGDKNFNVYFCKINVFFYGIYENNCLTLIIIKLRL